MTTGHEVPVLPVFGTVPLQKALQNAKLVVPPEIGHLGPVEAPDAVNRLIREFF